MFSNDKFRLSLLVELSGENISTNYYDLDKFIQLCANVLNNFAPIRGESHIDLRIQCVIMTLAGGRTVGVRELLLMTF